MRTCNTAIPRRLAAFLSVLALSLALGAGSG